MKRILLPLGILIVILACRTGPSERSERPNLYPTPTENPTQTPVVVRVKETVVVIQTTTPKPTMTIRPTEEVRLCVTATEAVHLRPSPSTENYPILQLERGEEVVDLGGRNSIWMFVQYRDKRGWVNGNFVEECE